MEIKIKDPSMFAYNSTYINLLYMAHYGTYPSQTYVILENRNTDDVIQAITEDGFEKIAVFNSVMYSSKGKKGTSSSRDLGALIKSLGEDIEFAIEGNQTSYFIHKEKNILINFKYSGGELKFCFTIDDESYVQDLAKKYLGLKEINPEDPNTQKIYILCQNSDGFYLKKIKLGNTEGIEYKYSKKFYPVDTHIKEKLNEKKQGIILLHGTPGTGKTSYIKYLTSKIDREFVIVPQNIIPHISSPNFVTFMLEQPDRVLVVEDAENAVASRDQSSGSVVGELLNLSDGLIGQAINCAIICTFNTDLKNIDSALLRKGRLIAEHKFEPLEEKEAKALFTHLGKPIPPGSELRKGMNLAEIYNYDVDSFRTEEVRGAIGFKKSY